MVDVRFGRRRLLGYGAGTAALVAAPGLVTACGDSSEPAATAVSGTVKLPDYVPSTLAKPDLAATGDGGLPGYFKYPRELVAAYTSPPGAGAGDVKVLTNILDPVPPGPDSNGFWKALNEKIGANVDITMTPQPDYPNKIATVLASGDLPDIMLIPTTLANRADVLTKLCMDLTPFVSGAAVREYKGLANIPTDSWMPTVYNGAIFAIPIPRAIVGTIMFSRADLIRQRGLNANPATYEEFVELARGMTDASKNHWAFGVAKGVIVFIGSMLGVPNVWKVDGGKFTSELETPERKEAVARVAQLVKDGLFHPDAIGGKLQLRDLFGNGTIGLNADGYAAWDLLADTYGVEVGGIPEPGPGKVHRAGAASFGLTAFKKAEPDRIKQLLRICDWLASPLGTTEYMFRKFGVEGDDYTWQGGLPVPTANGKTEVKLPLDYVADSPDVLGPGRSERVSAQRAYQQKVLPQLVRNPAAGLYSPAAASKQAKLDKLIEAAELDIVSGRKPISSWDDTVKNWLQQGGEQMRREYETAYSTSGGR